MRQDTGKIKNILFVEQNQDGTIGGSHYCLLYLVQCLDRSKYKPLVMFYEDNDIIAKFNDSKCDVIVYRKPKGIRFKRGFSFLQKIYNFFNINVFPFCRFMLLLKNKRIDLVHLNNSSSCGLEWLFAAKLLGKKCVTHERGWVVSKNFNLRFAKGFDRIICVSNAVKGQLVKLGLKDNSIVLYDAMDPVQYANKISKSVKAVRESFVRKNNIPFIGMVGNFQEWKGQMTVIKAIQVLIKKYPELVCLFVGSVSKSNVDDKVYYERLIDQINKSGIHEHVIITGYRSDVPDLVNAFDLLIHASIVPEPFGMVLLEAMCLNKAVIATDIGGPKEIVENGKSGILIQPGNPEELAREIDFLLANPAIRVELGANARERVNDKFSLDKFSLEINLFYDDLFVDS